MPGAAPGFFFDGSWPGTGIGCATDVRPVEIRSIQARDGAPGQAGLSDLVNVMAFTAPSWGG